MGKRVYGECEMKVTEKYLTEINACPSGIDWFKSQTETDAVALVKKLIAQDKLGWANWLICRIFNKKQNVQYAIYAAKLVLHIFEEKYPNDNRLRAAIEAVEKCLTVYSAADAAAAAAVADVAVAADAAADAAAVADTAIAADAVADTVAAAAAAADIAVATYVANADDAAYAAAAADAAAAATAGAAAGVSYIGGAGVRNKTRLKILNYGLSLMEDVK
jgi:hypothetical protein